VELPLLLDLLRAGRARYPHARLAVQTNGNRLDGPTLAALLDAGVDYVSVASYDRFHPQPAGQDDALRARFDAHGVVERSVGDPGTSPGARQRIADYSIWGTNPELWVGEIWLRGRAMKHGLARLLPEHNCCNRWSGALGFLDDGSSMQEIAIQLTTAYPCCRGTVEPLGDVAAEPLAAILDRHSADPVWRALNAGDPEATGLADGFDREHARRRIRELGSVCL